MWDIIGSTYESCLRLFEQQYNKHISVELLVPVRIVMDHVHLILFCLLTCMYLKKCQPFI